MRKFFLWTGLLALSLLTVLTGCAEPLPAETETGNGGGTETILQTDGNSASQTDADTESVQDAEISATDSAGGTDSPDTEQADGNVDIRNKLTKAQTDQLLALLEQGPIEYDALVAAYGKPNNATRSGELRYALEENGLLYLQRTEENGTLYGLKKVDYNHLPKTDIYLEQFKAFEVGKTTQEEIWQTVGAAHGHVGSGIVRAIYNTADGHRLSVYCENGVLYEIIQYHKDGTAKKIASLAPGAEDYEGQYNDPDHQITREQALMLYRDLKSGLAKYEDIVLKYGVFTNLFPTQGEATYKIQEGGIIVLKQKEAGSSDYRFDRTENVEKAENLTKALFDAVTAGTTDATEVLLLAGKPHEGTEESVYYTQDNYKITVRYADGLVSAVESEPKN